MSEDSSAPRAAGPSVGDAESRSKEQQRIILEIASRALENGYRNTKEVFDVAQKVGEKAHLIRNLPAYASRALFRVKERPRVREEQLADIEQSSAFADTSHVERIEAQILVRELLEGLSPSDREIFTRSMNGETCPEIDVAMDLKPRTAEIRLAVCKNTLRRAVQKKLKP